MISPDNINISQIVSITDINSYEDFNELRRNQNLITTSLRNLNRIPNFNVVYNFITSYPYIEIRTENEKMVYLANFIDNLPLLNDSSITTRN
jgi:hypothetical protein